MSAFLLEDAFPLSSRAIFTFSHSFAEIIDDGTEFANGVIGHGTDLAHDFLTGIDNLADDFISGW